jgi:hypothetical protein
MEEGRGGGGGRCRTRDEGREQIIFDVDLLFSNVCMQAKPSVGKRKNTTEDSSQFDDKGYRIKGEWCV